MQAIISDIHANLEALQAVEEDLKRHPVNRTICLGDFIGYGPNTKECTDFASQCNVCTKGNHEDALMVEFQGAGFNIKARGSLEWTREQLSMLGEDKEANAKRWDFMGLLQDSYQENGILYLHASPQDPITDYLYPQDIHNRHKMSDIFSRMDWICFLGHTHVPGIWSEEMVYLRPEDVNMSYQMVSGQKTIVNVGSVGQPRDGDPRACYALFDGKNLTFRKVEYPVEETTKKIQAISALDPSLAKRLTIGC